MNSDKKLYLYSGLSILGAIILYAIITKKKALTPLLEGSGSAEPEGTVAVTSTGEVIDQAQVNIPANLAKILNKTSAEATIELINKPVYTKLDDVKVRNDRFVNNGIINNILSKITNRGTLLGNVIQVVDDKGKLLNPQGKVYKWFKIKPAQITLDDMNRNKDFLTHTFLANSTGKEIFVREDAIKLEK
jgi:hypothetical protein